METIVERLLDALQRGDREAVRGALHPYLRWTRADGTTLVGRNSVLEMLAEHGGATAPASVEIRDGQVYRWSE
jgi:hypothetical protein